eukprot:7786875-Ditylum_brightwellii.AAC.1
MVESKSDNIKAISLTERLVSTLEDLRADICVITIFSIAVIWVEVNCLEARNCPAKISLLLELPLKFILKLDESLDLLVMLLVGTGEMILIDGVTGITNGMAK